MLSKINRVNTKEVEQIFLKGKSITSPSFTFKFIKGDKEKISFIVPKKISKKAVERNHLRRIGYAILSQQPLPALITGTFIFRKAEEDRIILTNEIKTILAKVN